MFDILFKKKITEDKLADYFVNSLIHLVDSSFEDVSAIINNDPSFVQHPQIAVNNSDEFLMIVIAGNLLYIPNYFNDYQDIRITDQIIRKFAQALGLAHPEMKELVHQYQSYFKKINHPSKNTHYAMSKAVFFKYNLNCFQEEYFKHMQTPNPMFLKRLDDLMANFIWQWDDILNKFKVIEY